MHLRASSWNHLFLFFLLFINYFRCLDPHAIHLNFLYFVDCELRGLSRKRKTLGKRLMCPLALIRFAEEMSNQSISAFAFDVVVDWAQSHVQHVIQSIIIYNILSIKRKKQNSFFLQKKNMNLATHSGCWRIVFLIQTGSEKRASNGIKKDTKTSAIFTRLQKGFIFTFGAKPSCHCRKPIAKRHQVI